MRTLILNTCQIPKDPSKTTKCFRCRESIGDDHVKAASLVVLGGNLRIDWEFFCGKCFKKICKVMYKEKL